MQSICVIGGSRYFGKLLVKRLRAAGHQVTVINRGSTRPPAGVEHLVVDRNDEAALTAALGSRTFDVVVDQVCYTPVQAAIAARAFAGRARRYVMTSTIEVYDPATAALPAVPAGTPVPEETVDPATWRVATDLPWHDDAYLEAHYAEGKRQAEAVFTGAGGFEFASVRSAHVLGGGAQEFTGRLAHYAERIAQGEEITVHAKALPTVFIHYEELADLLLWATTATFTGPVNACSDGALDVHDLAEIVAAQARREPVHRTVEAGEAASPFSFDRHYAMSNARAKALGFSFSRTTEWLPGAVAEALTTEPSPTS
ncbi:MULTISPECIES: NAD-dependent epimerase/dehydratase family protein [unclassified Streptomyces]|uniref:NAD-dependent epimerase/dehydratase family protein n=1 Tax=unclassified Streptomyces TaxID=2593676 RepID=UPI00224F02FB|nr:MULTISPECIES: NAD-dependent epimerase/dehydratase family protein [unclassified Streptomyces]MCX5062573.1 NAD-dependent epimerase/dehydratase family protein [Streptomyces sp. NBC_00452]MCX5291819.1 NAD-dependent epimerase/dehydratase family protein [Streptomyces sp. NBC_00183]